MAGNITHLNPVFSSNSKYLCCAEGSNLRLYLVDPFVASHLCLSAHKSLVTGMVASKTNDLQLFSSSKDGEVILWDIEDGSLLLRNSYKIRLIAMLASHKRELLYTVSYMGDRLTFHSIDMKKLDEKKFLVSMHFPLEPTNFQINSSENFIGFLTIQYNRVKLVLLCLNSFDYRSYEQPTKIEITTFCFDNDESSQTVYIGDKKGKITLYSFNEKLEELSKPLHWHDYSVNCLTLPENSSFLYSGGDKPVVAIWSLETGKPSFLSHLSGNILRFNVSPNQNFYAITCSDNTINIYNTIKQKKMKAVKGIIFDHKIKKNPPRPGFHYCNFMNAICFGGLPNTLQFFSVEKSKIINSLKVAPQLIENKRHMFHSKVKKICFSPSGDSLITLESTKFYQVLKFWVYNHNETAYLCVTEAPQGANKKINNILHHPHKDLVIETDIEGNFKIWVRKVEKEPQKKSYSVNWQAALLRSYKSDDSCFGSAFSKDGTILALVMKHEITLWETGGYTLIKTIPFSFGKNAVYTFGFLGDTHYIAAHVVSHESESHIFVWDTLRSIELWRYRYRNEKNLRLGSIYLDPVYPKIIALCFMKNISNSLFFCFSPLSPNPISFSIFPNQRITSLIFLPDQPKSTDSSHNQKVEINKNEFGSFPDKNSLTKFICFNARFEFITDTPTFSRLFKLKSRNDPLSVTQSLEKEEEETNFQPLPIQPIPHSFMGDTPSHVIPPVHSIYSNFMNEILYKLPQIEESNQSSSVPPVENSNTNAFNSSQNMVSNDDQNENLIKDKEVSSLTDVDTFLSFFSKLEIN